MALDSLIVSHGYWILAVGCLLEGETVLILAGYAAHRGYLDPFWVVAVASAGGFLGGRGYFWLGRRPATVVLGGHEPATLLAGQPPALSGLSEVERMMALDLLSYLPDDILTKVDRAAMGVSLETRVPFLDHRVVEFAWQLPLSYKLRREGNGYTSKWALRQVLYRHVPQALIERPKMGFGVPLHDWLRGPLREWAQELLDEARLAREGYFHPAPIRKIWAEHLSGQRNWMAPLWNVLMFQAWLEANRP